MAKATSTSILSACGEHYVASFLSGCGLIVALPRAGVPKFDLLVTREDNGPAIRIQVKTARNPVRMEKKVGGPIYLWRTSFAVIDNPDPHLWFAYVWVDGAWPGHHSRDPSIYFLPSSTVIATMIDCQQKNYGAWFWMKTTDLEQYAGRNGLSEIISALKKPL